MKKLIGLCLPAAVQAAAPRSRDVTLEPRRCRARCRPSEHALRSAPCFEGLVSAEALKRCNAPSPQGSCKSPRPIKQRNFCAHHGHRPGCEASCRAALALNSSISLKVAISANMKHSCGRHARKTWVDDAKVRTRACPGGAPIDLIPVNVLPPRGRTIIICRVVPGRCRVVDAES